MFDFVAALHWGALFQIIALDLLLGGDNAVVIALACRNLSSRRRIQGILWGTGGAILLRVLLIIFALALLDIPFLKAAGALMLIWIGVKLLAPAHDQHGHITSGATVAAAVKTIILADFAMSLDNVIAIAGAAQNTHVDHQVYYVIFGLCVSVPIIAWGSTLVLKLIDRFPMVVTLGAGLLGWIAGGMLVTDAFVIEQWGELRASSQRLVEAVCALLVIGIGKLLATHQHRHTITHHGV